MNAQLTLQTGIVRLFAPAALLSLWLAAASATAGEARPEMVLDLGDNATMKLVRIPKIGDGLRNKLDSCAGIQIASRKKETMA
jgi:hypothetical protein